MENIKENAKKDYLKAVSEYKKVLREGMLLKCAGTVWCAIYIIAMIVIF